MNRNFARFAQSREYRMQRNRTTKSFCLEALTKPLMARKVPGTQHVHIVRLGGFCQSLLLTRRLPIGPTFERMKATSDQRTVVFQNLLILVTFDFVDPDTKDYASIETALGAMNLGRTIWKRGGESIRLPNNTFGAIRNAYLTVEQAADHVMTEMKRISLLEGFVGKAMVAACPIEAQNIRGFALSGPGTLSA